MSTKDKEDTTIAESLNKVTRMCDPLKMSKFPNAESEDKSVRAFPSIG